jgi:threonine dehydratase
MDLSVQRIEEAAQVIDPAFRDSPQFVHDRLSGALGRRVLVKVETLNPLRNFKGRGAQFLAARLNAGLELACSSTGNFGQAIAYAARARGMAAHVFVPEDVNPGKLDRLRSLDAVVTVGGVDVQEAKLAARAYARSRADRRFVEDGKDPEISEGAGTIGVELIRAEPVDTVVLPVGDGALITGVARWLKHHLPDCHIVGVCAAGAPAMAQSWRTGTPAATAAVDTIADGIAVRAPIPESVQRMCQLVDDVVLVDDAALLDAMGLILATLGVVPEPAGAAGIAAIGQHDLPGDRLATVITGGNIRPDLLPQLRGALSPAAPSAATPEPYRLATPMQEVVSVDWAPRRWAPSTRHSPRGCAPSLASTTPRSSTQLPLLGRASTFPSGRSWSSSVPVSTTHGRLSWAGRCSCRCCMAAMRTWPFPCRTWRCQGAPMTHVPEDPALPVRRIVGLAHGAPTRLGGAVTARSPPAKGGLELRTIQQAGPHAGGLATGSRP